MRVVWLQTMFIFCVVKLVCCMIFQKQLEHNMDFFLSNWNNYKLYKFICFSCTATVYNTNDALVVCTYAASKGNSWLSRIDLLYINNVNKNKYFRHQVLSDDVELIDYTYIGLF